MPVEVRYQTDPACAWSWGSEPKLRKLFWQFEGELDFVWVMGGLARQFTPDYREAGGSSTMGSGSYAGLIAHWLDVGEQSGMPCDPRLWTQNPIASSYPACMAVKAACEQGSELGYRYLRRLREGLMLERRKLDHPEALVAESAAAGLDVQRFKVDLGSHAITERFGADLEEVRDVPDAAREAGAVRSRDGKERVAFPAAIFIGSDGERHGVWGWRPYEAYRDAAIAAGASVTNASPLEPVVAVERFGRLATQEAEALAERARPLIEAELWALASEWKLKPVRVITGTMWEKP